MCRPPRWQYQCRVHCWVASVVDRPLRYPDMRGGILAGQCISPLSTLSTNDTLGYIHTLSNWVLYQRCWFLREVDMSYTLATPATIYAMTLWLYEWLHTLLDAVLMEYHSSLKQFTISNKYLSVVHHPLLPTNMSTLHTTNVEHSLHQDQSGWCFPPHLVEALTLSCLV